MRLIIVSVLTAAAAIAFAPVSRAQDACSASAAQRKCSIECCGRLDCTPSCQAYCVRACIDACRDAGKLGSYQSKLSAMKQRCGYVVAPSQVAPK